jgi:prepilin-type N-terminal cleavage/methylation domain-containing protein
MRERLRTQEGFGLVELVISMTILSVALLALVAGLNSGLLSLQRSARISTADTLADAQMERFRAVKYADIRLDSASVTTANSDTTYTSDSAWNATQVTASCAGVPPLCNPRRTVTGPDGRSYRVDTYIVAQTPAGARELKLVTVVVRNGTTPANPPFARLTSRFDQSISG